MISKLVAAYLNLLSAHYCGQILSSGAFTLEDMTVGLVYLQVFMTEHAWIVVCLAIITTHRLQILWAKVTHLGRYSVMVAHLSILNKQNIS